MANYRGGTGYGSRSFHRVSDVVGGQGMRSDIFGALGQLGNVSGAAVGGTGVGVSAQPSPLRFSGLESGNVSLSGLPSGASVGGMVPSSGMAGGGGGLDPSALLAGLPPELQAVLMQQALGLGSGSGVGAGGASGVDGSVFEAVGRRLIEILLNQGGLEKLLGVKGASGAGSVGGTG